MLGAAATLAHVLVQQKRTERRRKTELLARKTAREAELRKDVQDVQEKFDANLRKTSRKSLTDRLGGLAKKNSQAGLGLTPTDAELQ